MHIRAERLVSEGFGLGNPKNGYIRDREYIREAIEQAEQVALAAMQKAEDLRRQLDNPQPVIVMEPCAEGHMPLHVAMARVVARFDSQADAAYHFGIGKTYVSRLLSGDKCNPSEEVLASLGLVQHVRVGYTLAGEDS